MIHIKNKRILEEKGNLKALFKKSTYNSFAKAQLTLCEVDLGLLKMQFIVFKGCRDLSFLYQLRLEVWFT